MGTLDRLWAWRMRTTCETELVCRGGVDLLADARIEATWYANLHHPWDGRGDEPADRVNAWLSILVARLTMSRNTCCPWMPT